MMHPIERSSSISGVILETNPSRIERALKKYAQRFQNQPSLPGEKAKTPAQIRVLQSLLPLLTQYSVQLGASPLYLTPEHFHLIESPEAAHRLDLGSNTASAHRVYEQDVVVNLLDHAERYQDLVTFAEDSTHEGLHFLGYNELLSLDDYPPISARLGLKYFESSRMRAFDLDEALVVEMQRDFKNNFFWDIPILKEALIKRGEGRMDNTWEFASEVDEETKPYSDKHLMLTSIFLQTAIDLNVDPTEIRKTFYRAHMSGDKSKFDELKIKILKGEVAKDFRTLEESSHPISQIGLRV